MKNCIFKPNPSGGYTCENCGLTLPRGDIKANCKATLNDLPPNTESPSLLQRAWNFGKAAINHVLAGNPVVPEEVMKARLDICRSCPLFKPNHNQVGGVCTHSSCGCNIQDNLDYLNKIAWADQECPIKRWGKFEQKNEDKGV
jgi:hypothetical protein